MRTRTKRIFLILAVFISTAAGVTAWYVGLFSGELDAPVGVYLTNGGRALFVIERDGVLGYRTIPEGFPLWSSPLDKPDYQGLTIRVDSTAGQFQVVQSEEFLFVPERERFESELHLVLERSKWVEGDWDLVEGEVIARSKVSNVRNFSSPSFGDLFERIVARVIESFQPPETYIHAQLTEAHPPVVSFLHRIDDPRLVEYFNSRTSWTVSSESLEIIRELFADLPEDPYLALHVIDGETLSGNFDQAKELMETWRPRFDESSDSLLRANVSRAMHNLWRAQGDPRGNDFHEVLSACSIETLDLERTLSVFRGMLANDFLLKSKYSTVDAPPGTTGLEPRHVDYLPVQNKARLAATQSMLFLFEGGREESLELLAGLYQFGQTMNAANAALIQKLIGLAIRLIANTGLDSQLTNACDTLSEAKELIDALERLGAIWGPQREEDWSGMEGPFPTQFFKEVVNNGFDFRQAFSRQQATDSRFNVTRTAAAAKHYLLATGAVPNTTAELASYFERGFPLDLFTGRPIRISATDEQNLVVYSYGPDKADDRGRFSYSPTNGAVSTGDILLRVPKDPEFPFPREGVRASSAEDLLAQFENGLPEGVWQANRGKYPLFGVVQSTSTTPVYIYSLGPEGKGPDRPDSGIVTYDAFREFPTYSPTNGIKSPGLMSIPIPPN